MNQFNSNAFSNAYEGEDTPFYGMSQPPSAEVEREENLELIGILLTEEFEDAFQEDVFAGVA